jgi:hypothetical protein
LPHRTTRAGAAGSRLPPRRGSYPAHPAAPSRFSAAALAGVPAPLDRPERTRVPACLSSSAPIGADLRSPRIIAGRSPVRFNRQRGRRRQGGSPRAHTTDEQFDSFPSASVLAARPTPTPGRPGNVFDSRCSCPFSSTLAKPLHTATSPPAPLRSSASRAVARTSSAWEAPSAISSRISTFGLHRAAGAPPPSSLPPPRPRRPARPAPRCPSDAPRFTLPHYPSGAPPSDERAALRSGGHQAVAGHGARGAPGAPERATSCAPERTLRIAAACATSAVPRPALSDPARERANNRTALRHAQRSLWLGAPRRSAADATALGRSMRLRPCDAPAFCAAHALACLRCASAQWALIGCSMLMRSALVRSRCAWAHAPAAHRRCAHAPSAAGADAVRALKRARPLPRAACTHGAARIAAAGAACRSLGSSVSADLAAALGDAPSSLGSAGRWCAGAAGAASGKRRLGAVAPGERLGMATSQRSESGSEVTCR